MCSFKVCTEKRKSVYSLTVEYRNIHLLNKEISIYPLSVTSRWITPVLKTLYIYDLIWTLLDTGFLVKQKWLGSDSL